jgi:hypothetical protein
MHESLNNEKRSHRDKKTPPHKPKFPFSTIHFLLLTFVVMAAPITCFEIVFTLTGFD